jgi:hypothetical protein
MTDSSTGGYLLPIGIAPLEGQALNRFLQAWLVGLSGFDPTLVRPMFQSEPPNIPPAATAWMAFRYNTRPSDGYPFNNWDPNTGTYIMRRYEELHILCSFYDTGTNGLADFWAAQTRDGSAIAQNLEQLYLNLMAFVICGDLVAVPSLLKERWLYRVDLPITIRRQINRVYAITTVTSLVGTLNDDTGLPPTPVDVPHP